MDKWKELKKLIKNCYEQTDENKMTNEKGLYKSLLDIMELHDKIELIENINKGE